MDYTEKFTQFIKGITKKDRVALYHDLDGDGISAAAIATIALNRLKIKVKLNLGKGRDELTPSKESIEELKKNKITILITLDKPLDKSPETIREIATFAKVLMIDHHSNEREVNYQQENILIFKPQFFSNAPPSKYATTKIVFDYFSKLTNIEDLDWIACAGTMSDTGDTYWIDFFKGVMIKYKFKGDDPWKTPLERIIGYISMTESFKKGYYKKALKNLIKSNGYKDFLDSNLKEYYDKVNGEIKSYIDGVEKNAEFKDDLVIYEVKPKYDVKSILSTIISRRIYPEKTVILILDDKSDKFKLSFRRNDFKKDMSKLAKESLKGLTDMNPGGHIPAAGGALWRIKLAEFKKRVTEVNSSGTIDVKPR